MDNRFIEQYLLNAPDLREKMWDDCIFVLDANVLLNLYLYTNDTRHEFLSVLKCVDSRIWFSSQVIIEFHNNRIEKITRQKNEYERIKSNIKSRSGKINRTNGEILQSFEEMRQLFKQESPYYNFEKEAILLEKYEKGILEKLEKTINLTPNYVNDEILNELSVFFKKNKITEFTEIEIEKIKTEGALRYENKIPPGYTDIAKKKDDCKEEVTNEYGDLIIWKELIKTAKKMKKPVIFITDERKEDFWEIKDRKILYPRLELVKEFYDETKQYFWIHNSKKFLSHIAKYCQDIEKGELDKAIKEIDQVQEVNHYVGTFIIEWTNLEKVLQNLHHNAAEASQEQSGRRRYIPLGRIISELEISSRWINEFKYMNDFRNKLVHGFISPKMKELEDVIYTVKDFSKYLNTELKVSNSSEY